MEPLKAAVIIFAALFFFLFFFKGSSPIFQADFSLTAKDDLAVLTLPPLSLELGSQACGSTPVLCGTENQS